MSTSTPSPETISNACDFVAEECMNRYCSVGGWNAPTEWTDTIDGVTVSAEVEGDPDGNYVSFIATVNGVEVASGSVVGRTFEIEMVA